MSFIQKLTFLCQILFCTGGSVGRVLEPGLKDRWFETHRKHFYSLLIGPISTQEDREAP